ncbi:MAG: efflux RND transporter periplasmic adaptor subunit [Thermodesulfovibrionales bacterium]
MANEDLSKLRIDKSGAAPSAAGKNKTLYIVLAIIFILIVGVVSFRTIISPAVVVEVATVGQIYPSQTITLLNASGYVVAQRKAALASKVTGRLVEINVEEGDVVKKGEVVARLENEDSGALKKQAAANLEVARAELERTRAELNDAAVNLRRQKDLLAKEYISRLEYDSSEARYKMAAAVVAGAEASIRANAAALQNAEVSLEYTFIRAPFDAVVLTKNADIGDIITPIGAAAEAKAAVVTIADMDSLLVEADVSESNLKQVRSGQACEIQLDAFSDMRFRGEVHMIVPTADRTRASVLVKVKFLDKDSRVLPEMSAKVAFLERPLNTEELKPQTGVNSSSIITRGSQKYVFLIKEDKAIETPVSTGKQSGDMTEILAGIKPGDKIVLKPTGRIKNNTRIKSAEK